MDLGQCVMLLCSTTHRSLLWKQEAFRDLAHHFSRTCRHKQGHQTRGQEFRVLFQEQAARSLANSSTEPEQATTNHSQSTRNAYGSEESSSCGNSQLSKGPLEAGCSSPKQRATCAGRARGERLHLLTARV